MLKSNVMMIMWDRTVVGREQAAVAFFSQTLELYAKWQAAGRIQSFEEVILSPHRGDVNGFVLIRGDADKLTALRQDGEFMSMVYQSGYFLERFGVVEAYSGDVLKAGMQDWNAVVDGLK